MQQVATLADDGPLLALCVLDVFTTEGFGEAVGGVDCPRDELPHGDVVVGCSSKLMPSCLHVHTLHIHTCREKCREPLI